MFVILPLYTKTVDFKSNSQAKIYVQILSFNSSNKSFTLTVKEAQPCLYRHRFLFSEAQRHCEQ